MNDATVKFGYDGSALRAGLRSDEQYLHRSAGQMEKSMARIGSKSGGGMRGLGNMSMQIQDIAVQMQMGTKMSTIMAQQGSQMLSAFGPGGAILGGLLAVGGAFYTSKVKGEEMFQALKKESADFDKNLRSVSAGGITDMINGMEDMQKRSVELRKELASQAEATTWNKVINPLKKFFSASTFDAATGKWTNQADAETATKTELAKKAEEGRKQLIEQIVTSSNEDLGILKLKLSGQNEEAAILERQIKLKRELTKLDAAPTEIKAQLQKNAIATAEAEAQAAARAAKAKATAAEDELAKKRESIKLSQMDVEILEAQAKGQTRKVKKMEEFAFVQKRAHDFSAQGMDANAAIELAQREWNARENIEKRKKTGRSHIGGVGAKRMMGGSLDEFQRLQNTSTYSMQNSLMPGPFADDPRKVNVPQFSDSLSGRRNSTMKSRMMGGDSLGAQFGAGSLTNRRPGTTANPQISAAVAKGNDAATKLDTTNELLKRGLLGG